MQQVFVIVSKAIQKNWSLRNRSLFIVKNYFSLAITRSLLRDRNWAETELKLSWSWALFLTSRETFLLFYSGRQQVSIDWAQWTIFRFKAKVLRHSVQKRKFKHWKKGTTTVGHGKGWHWLRTIFKTLDFTLPPPSRWFWITHDSRFPLLLSLLLFLDISNIYFLIFSSFFIVC